MLRGLISKDIGFFFFPFSADFYPVLRQTLFNLSKGFCRVYLMHDSAAALI